MLHQLGDERLDVDSDHVLATRRKDGSLAIALWNYVSPGQNALPITIVLGLPHEARAARVV